MILLRSRTLRKVPRRICFRVISANQRSILLSHEELVGGEVHVTARAFSQPLLHRLMLMGSVTVEHKLAVQSGAEGLINSVETPEAPGVDRSTKYPSAGCTAPVAPEGGTRRSGRNHALADDAHLIAVCDLQRAPAHPIGRCWSLVRGCARSRCADKSESLMHSTSCKAPDRVRVWAA
jgi:hypothetical protein